MRRRGLLAGLLLAGCGLATRPYAERRQWPLTVPRPALLPPLPGGRVLLVRTLRAGPGLEARGLQTLRADGSIETGFYEEWASPPAEAVEEALRQWLAACGRFSAVVAPGSRVTPDLVLEGELTGLWTDPPHGVAHAAIGVTVLAQDNGRSRVANQQRIAVTAPLVGDGAAAHVVAQRAALADAFGRIETLL